MPSNMPIRKSRARFLVLTFMLPFALLFVMTGLGVLGDLTGPRQIVYQTVHSVDAGQAEFDFLKARIEAFNAGDPRVQAILLNAHEQEAEGCEGRLVALDVVFHAGIMDLSIGEPHRALVRESLAAGLGSPCGGLRIKMESAGGVDDRTWLTPLFLAPLALVILCFNWLSRRGRRPLWLNWADWQPRVGVMTALRLGVGYAMVALLVAVGLGAFADLLGWLPDKPGMLPTLKQWPWLIVAILLAPVFEEFIFRAWLLERLTRVMRDWMALLVSTGAFAAIHFPSSAFEWLNLFLVGLVFGLLWLRTRSLIAVAVAHALFNATLLTLQMMLSG